MKRAALALAVMLWPAAARAGDVDQCARAYEHGQELRISEQLSAAREEFLVCARPACPKAARSDCARWLGEVEALLPGVVVHATHAGAPLDDARILIDGKVVSERADAHPLTLDPGNHVVRIEPRGCVAHEKTVSLSSGVPTDVSFDVCTEPKPVEQHTRVSRRPPIATFVLAGVGVAALASFAVFGAIGLGDSNALRSTCYPNCDSGPVASANAELAAADVSLGIAIACAAASAIVWLVAPRIVRQTALASPLRWSFRF